MPKVKGPLLSLSASGVFGGLIEFKTGEEGTIATRTKVITKGRTTGQKDQAERFQNACTGWRALDSSQKLNWKARGANFNLNGFQYYIREYLEQGITPPDQPE